MSALTLAFLFLIVLKASERLFCLLCPFPADLCRELSLRACQRSSGEGLFINPFKLLKYGPCCVSSSGKASMEVRGAMDLLSLGNLFGTLLRDGVLVE